MSGAYPFYKSLRFRFGAVFGALSCGFLLFIAIFLYARVKRQFENAFTDRMNAQAEVLLEKVELDPLTLPVPQSMECFLLLYDRGRKTDTLFRHFPPGISFAAAGYRRSVVRTRTLETGGSLVVRYAASSGELDARNGELRSILFLYFPVAFAIALLAGYFLSGFLLRPIARIIRQANGISLRQEIRLLPLPPVEDELYQLTVSLNRMLERIREQAGQQTAFFASAAHELRTPLSLMLTELQVFEAKALPLELAAVVRHQVTEVQRLSRLVNTFLLMSRGEDRTGTARSGDQGLPLPDLLVEAMEGMKHRAEEKKVQFKIALMPADADFRIRCDGEQLHAILSNLLDNAIKFSPENALISVSLSKEIPAIGLSVSNETKEVLPDLEKLKKRFEKGDAQHGGFGLGLWIVDTFCALNGAKFVLSFAPPVFSAGVFFVAANHGE